MQSDFSSLTVYTDGTARFVKEKNTLDVYPS